MMRESVMAGGMFFTKEQLNPYIQNKLLLAIMSSLPGCIMSIPLDVFKTRAQTHRSLDIMTTVRLEGVGVFFKGGLLRVMKALPQTTITMYVYDLMTSCETAP